jgi:hypothetical protein
VSEVQLGNCGFYVLIVLLPLERLTRFVNPVFLNSLPRAGLSICFRDDSCFVFPLVGILSASLLFMIYSRHFLHISENQCFSTWIMFVLTDKIILHLIICLFVIQRCFHLLWLRIYKNSELIRMCKVAVMVWFKLPPCILLYVPYKYTVNLRQFSQLQQKFEAVIPRIRRRSENYTATTFETGLLSWNCTDQLRFSVFCYTWEKHARIHCVTKFYHDQSVANWLEKSVDRNEVSARAIINCRLFGHLIPGGTGDYLHGVAA